MIQILYDKGTVVLVGNGVEDFYFKYSRYLWLKWDGRMATCSWKYLDELSNMLGPFSDELVLSNEFKEVIALFRKNNTLEKAGKKKTIVLHSHVNTTYIMNKNYPYEEIDKVTRYFDIAAKNSKAYNEGRWDGYFRLFDKREASFPSGLLELVLETLEGLGHGYTVIYKYHRRPAKKFDWRVEDNIIPDPDQVDAVDAAYEAGRSIVKAATGFGKVA